MASDWLTLVAAANHMGADVAQVRRLIDEGTLSPMGEGGEVRVRRSDLDRYVEERAIRERIEKLAAQGLSIEVVARTVGTTRYRVERVVGGGRAQPAGEPYRYRKLRAEADIAGRYRGGESAEVIAHDLGVSVTLVFEELKRQRVALRGRVDPWVLTYADVLTDGYLRREYLEKRRGAFDIAAEIGCSETTVRNWMRRHSIKPRPISDRRRAYKYPRELLKRVATGELTAEAASVVVGCSRTELMRALRRSGVGLSKKRELTAEFLEEHYVNGRKTCPEIAAETGWSTQTVRARLIALGIPRRRGAPRRRS